MMLKDIKDLHKEGIKRWGKEYEIKVAEYRILQNEWMESALDDTEYVRKSIKLQKLAWQKVIDRLEKGKPANKKVFWKIVHKIESQIIIELHRKAR